MCVCLCSCSWAAGKWLAWVDNVVDPDAAPDTAFEDGAKEVAKEGAKEGSGKQQQQQDKGNKGRKQLLAAGKPERKRFDSIPDLIAHMEATHMQVRLGLHAWSA